MTSSATTVSRPLSTSNVALVTALLLFDSLHFVFAKLLHAYISPAVSVFYVLGISTIEVGLFALAQQHLHLGTLKRHFWFFLAIGFLVAASTNINYEAMAFLDPGTASLLAQTSILFGLGFGVLWLRDRLTRKQIGGVMLTALGVFVISFQPGDYLRLGSLMVVGSALMYALHAALTKRHGGEIDFLDFFFGRLLFTTAVLFCFSAARGALAWPSLPAWRLLLLVGTVDVALSRALYYIALRRLTMSMHTIILTLTPILAIIWSLLFFRVMPTPAQLAGGAAIIAGVLVVTRGNGN
jgi:drug/metabolite transporter (DMT)-like permease